MKYRKIYEINNKRWSDQLRRPLHAAGNILNRELFYDDNVNDLLDAGVWNRFYDCIEKLIRDAYGQDKITDQFSTYRNVEGLFGCSMAIRQRSIRSPGEKCFYVLV